MKILILGASGMLGHTLFHILSRESNLDVCGAVRNRENALPFFNQLLHDKIIGGIDAFNYATVESRILEIKPDVVINCIGLIRQKPEGQQRLTCIEINSRLPHLLYQTCSKSGIRVIHYSTDCVFDGHKGEPYTEKDPCSAKDVYGISKYLGELHEKGSVTIRTSIIGHELSGKYSLIEWFLSQENETRGFRKAIYSGLPTSEHAYLLRDVILKNPELSGLFHVSSAPISKFDLLILVAREYKKQINIIPNDDVTDDKRLNGDLFRGLTGYVAPPWEVLVRNMHIEQKNLLNSLSKQNI